MKKQLLSLCAILLCSLALFSCDKSDKKDKGSNGTGTDSGKQEELLSADDSKKKLEDIGIELTSFVRAADFDSTLDAVEGIVNALNSYKEGNLDPITTLLEDFADDLDSEKITSWDDYISASNPLYFDYTDYYGVYTFKNGDWTFKESNSELKFIVYDVTKNKPNTATLECSKAKYKFGSDRKENEIPGSVTAVFTSSNDDKLNFSYEISEFDYNKHTFVGKGSIALNNYVVATSQSLKNNTLSLSTTVSNGKVKLFSIDAKSEDFEFDWSIEEHKEGYDGYYYEWTETEWEVETGKLNSTINILDKLWIKGSCSDIKRIAEYDGDNITDLLTDEINVTWGYSSVDVQGRLVFEEEDEDLLLLLEFDEDKSRVDLFEFFTEDNFEDFITAAEDLVDDFADMFDKYDFSEDDVVVTDKNTLH